MSSERMKLHRPELRASQGNTYIWYDSIHYTKREFILPPNPPRTDFPRWPLPHRRSVAAAAAAAVLAGRCPPHPNPPGQPCVNACEAAGPLLPHPLGPWQLHRHPHPGRCLHRHACHAAIDHLTRARWVQRLRFNKRKQLLVCNASPELATWRFTATRAVLRHMD